MIFLIGLSFQVNAVNQDTRPYELAHFDKKLNKCYKKILEKLSPSDQIKLRKAQRQWIVFRDLDCTWSFRGAPFDCMIERTINRTKELKETMFDDTKGNYSSLNFDN
jgi:uncharacterized protein YecT (DUF1311 family)